MSAPLPHSVEVIIESTYGAFLLGGLAAFAYVLPSAVVPIITHFASVFLALQIYKLIFISKSSLRIAGNSNLWRVQSFSLPLFADHPLGCNSLVRSFPLLFFFGSHGFHRLIDVFHSCVLCASLWYYLISRYGDLSVIDTVPW